MSTTQKRKQMLQQRKQKLQNLCQIYEPQSQSYNLLKRAIKIDRIENIQNFTTKYLLKNNPTLQLTQAYETPLPFLMMKWEDVFEEELSSAMCALANQEQGGFILIATKCDGSRIQQGLSNFQEKDSQRLQDLVRRALKSIAHNQSIQVKVEGLIFYPDFQTALAEKENEEFVIKLTVCRRPESKKFYFIEQKLINFKPIHEFFTVKKSNYGSQDVFCVHKVTGFEIYDLMCDLAKNSLKPKTAIWKNISTGQKLRFDLLMLITKNEKRKIQLLFDSNPEHLLVSILQALAYYYQQEVSDQFCKIEEKFTVIQVQISDRHSIESSVDIIKEFLQESKTRYKFIQPLMQFQKELIKFKIAQKFKLQPHYICYLVLEESYLSFSAGLKKLIDADFEKRFIIDEVKCKFTLGVPLNDYELQASQNFLWHYFTCIPKHKKQLFANSNYSNGSAFKSVSFYFEKYDMSVAVFAYFIFTLAQRRPH